MQVKTVRVYYVCERCGDTGRGMSEPCGATVLRYATGVYELPSDWQSTKIGVLCGPCVGRVS